jgi:hypothetical protein
MPSRAAANSWAYISRMSSTNSVRCKVKAIADIRKLGLDDIDALIHEFHGELAKTKEVAPPTPASMVPDSREGSVDMLS